MTITVTRAPVTEPEVLFWHPTSRVICMATARSKSAACRAARYPPLSGITRRTASSGVMAAAARPTVR